MGVFDYDAFLDGLGIRNGDLLDVASDMISIMMYCTEKRLEFDPNVLIDKILNRVGAEGTVVIRTFNWRFCKGACFDKKKPKDRREFSEIQR